MGDRKVISSGLRKSCVLYWFVGGDDVTGALHVLSLQLSPLTTSIILSSNKIQNGDMLVLANQVHLGK